MFRERVKKMTGYLRRMMSLCARIGHGYYRRAEKWPNISHIHNA